MTGIILANKKPGDIDMLIVRENTEGEYSSVGGRMFKDTDREIAVQETIMSAPVSYTHLTLPTI